MGATVLQQNDLGLVLILPAKVDKNFAKDLLDDFKLEKENEHIVFDFSKTLFVDNNFYPTLHQIRQKVKKLNCTFSSTNVNSALRSQFQTDGVYRMFNVEMMDSKKPSQKFNMDVEFITPFIDSTVEILSIQANTKAHAGKPKLKEPNQQSEFDIVGVITLISNVFEGSITLCFKGEVFLKICSNMLGEEINEINNDIEDAAGELLNIIFGMAKAKLNDEKGYKIEKAIPTIIRGPGIRVKQTLGPTIILPFESDAGNFHIEIELAESKEY